MAQTITGKMDEYIRTHCSSPEKERLLLHSCCAPCSSVVMERLSSCFEISIFYYNPNIDMPEYTHRLSEQKRLIHEMFPDGRVCICDAPYDPDRFKELIRGLEGEPEGGKRCEVCFSMRLESTAKKAKDGGFDCFSTTLTVGPMKDVRLINRIGFDLGEKYGVSWLPGEFRKRDGYKRSLELSKKYNLYRQNYCGCAYSVRV